jgi:two-component system, chemotaxis family, sensor kinase CheA
VFQEFIKEFITEAIESLAQLDEDFIELERSPGNRDRLESIYGGVHTIKGSAGFFAFTHLEAVAHAGEDLLQDLVEGHLQVSSDIISALLSMVDALREMLDVIDATDGDGTKEYEELVDQLYALRGADAPVRRAIRSPIVEPPLPDADAPPAPQVSTPAPTPEAQPNKETPPASSPEPDTVAETIAETIADDKPATEPVTAAAPPSSPAPEPTKKAATEHKETTTTRTQSAASATIRVSVELLDQLMGLVGELVLSRNQVLQHASVLEDRASTLSFQQLDLITTELQQAVMKTRMQPIKNIFKKFPRVVRDLAITCGKTIDLIMEGEGTELDKSLLEAISAPLTHIIRNAIDHGIETPEERSLAGKPESGTLRLSAFHESGHVNIEIADDGAGIALEKVRTKAVTVGLITVEQAAGMSDDEITRLIFSPGFSTNEQVSTISGRGVGMNVVRTELEQIGGTIDIHTHQGEGTVLKIKIPLTLAIIPALIVTCRGERFAIPQVNLREAVHLKGDQVKKSIERVHNVPVYRLRGRLLPLVDLGAELGFGKATKRKDKNVNLVVLTVDGQEFGLIVDSIRDTFEIVVKPVSRLVKGKACFAGATIMDDGRPALILDVLGIARRSRVLTADLDTSLLITRKEEVADTDSSENILLFTGARAQRLGMPLYQVGRLELFPKTQVEEAGGRHVIQYRDKILPLVDILSLLGESTENMLERSGEVLHVVVYDYHNRTVGLVVGTILDIVEESVTIKGQSSRNGVIGTAVIRGRVTELLDPDVLLKMTDLSLDESGEVTVFGAKRHG